MDEIQLRPVAAILSDAYLATWAYSKTFAEEHGQPPSLLARVHHMRSIAQASFVKDERYELSPEYVEYGRVMFTDLTSGQAYLLRSRSGLLIEQEKMQRALFDANKYFASPVVMVVYRFHPEGLDLSITGTVHHAKRTHLQPTGSPTFIAMWPFAIGEHDAFDQRAESDPFGHLGDLNIEDEEQAT